MYSWVIKLSKGVSFKETVVLRRWVVLQDNQFYQLG